MTAEPSAQIQSFIDGRDNLRSLTKWLLSGVAGVVTLIVGASTFSNLGTLGPMSWRLWMAALCLAIAAGVCWIALRQAILVLQSEIFSLEAFGQAHNGDLAAAIAKVSETLAGQLGDNEAGAPLTAQAFAQDFRALRSKAWSDALTAGGETAEASGKEDRAKEAVAILDRRRQVVLQACLSALVQLRFARFVEVLSKYSLAALAALLVFVYCANPPKTPDRETGHSVVVSLSSDTLAGLARLPHAGCCACVAGPTSTLTCPPPQPPQPPQPPPTPPTRPSNPWVAAGGWLLIFVGLTLFLFFRHLSRERIRGR